MKLGESLCWNENIKLIVSDVDDTIAEVFRPALPEMIFELESLLFKGIVIFLISGQSIGNIYNRVLRFINKPLLSGILVGHCNGSEVYGFDSSGELISKPIFNVSEYYKYEVDYKKLRQCVSTVLNKYNLKTLPFIEIDEFKKITKNDTSFLMLDDRTVQISLDFVNGLAVKNFKDYSNAMKEDDIRIPILNDLTLLLKANKLNIEPHLSGTCAIDLNIKGVTKGLPLKRLIHIGEKFKIELPKKIIISNSNEVEVWGDSFSYSHNGSDQYMSTALPRDVRSISFRDIDKNDLRKGYNIISWNGRHRYHLGLLEYLKSRKELGGTI